MIKHWLAVRRCVVSSMVFFIVSFMACFYASDALTHIVLSPLLNALPNSGALVLTKVGASLFLTVNVAAKVALFLTLPFLFFELWRFALPGLYPKERQVGKGFLASGLVLFILGAVFCFYVLLPWLFACLVNYTPNNIHLMLDAADAISLTFQLMVVFGLCFQLPLICVLLEKMGWVRLTQLNKQGVM